MRRENNDGLDGARIQISLKRYNLVPRALRVSPGDEVVKRCALLTEDKMAAGAFGRAMNFG